MKLGVGMWFGIEVFDWYLYFDVRWFRIWSAPGVEPASCLHSISAGVWVIENVHSDKDVFGIKAVCMPVMGSAFVEAAVKAYSASPEKALILGQAAIVAAVGAVSAS